MLKIIGVLLLWEPVRFAGEALMVLRTLSYRGAAAVIELTLHGAVAALAAAAGFALWNSSPAARRLGIVAVVALVARVIQSLYFSVLPNNTIPGDEPIAAAIALVGGALIVAVIGRRTG